MFISVGAVTASRLGLRNRYGIAVNVEHPGGINITGNLNFFDQALNVIARERAHIGAQENRLEHIYNNLTTQELNLSEARSRIVDVDMYRETMRFVRANMRQQAAVMMLAQAGHMQMTQSLALINNMVQPSFIVGSQLS